MRGAGPAPGPAATGPRPAVLHVAQSGDYGVTGFLEALLADQAARGWRVGLAGPVPLAGARHLPWHAGREPGPAVVAEARTLASALARFEPDVVHLHSSKAGLVGRLVVRGRLPTVFQPHAWSFLAVHGPRRAAARSWERWAAPWAHRIVCCSEAERSRGERTGVRGRWEVVPNPVDLGRFRAGDGRSRASARRRLGLGPRPLAVCVGRLSRQKGQDVLLDAWPAVGRRVRGARLALVGEGPERHRLEALAPVGVCFAGRQDDVVPWLHAADVVVQPSRYEGQSLVVLEAMACGRAVVATDVEGMGEALGADAGALVPPDDPGALAEAVAARLADPELADREGRAGRARAERHHDRRCWGDRLAAVTLAVLDRPRR